MERRHRRQDVAHAGLADKVGLDHDLLQ
jgi:hypothetical protein